MLLILTYVSDRGSEGFAKDMGAANQNPSVTGTI